MAFTLSLPCFPVSIYVERRVQRDTSRQGKAWTVEATHDLREAVIPALGSGRSDPRTIDATVGDMMAARRLLTLSSTSWLTIRRRKRRDRPRRTRTGGHDVGRTSPGVAPPARCVRGPVALRAPSRRRQVRAAAARGPGGAVGRGALCGARPADADDAVMMRSPVARPGFLFCELRSRDDCLNNCAECGESGRPSREFGCLCGR
jgi:hypothetical protein